MGANNNIPVLKRWVACKLFIKKIILLANIVITIQNLYLLKTEIFVFKWHFHYLRWQGQCNLFRRQLLVEEVFSPFLTSQHTFLSKKNPVPVKLKIFGDSQLSKKDSSGHPVHATQIAYFRHLNLHCKSSTHSGTVTDLNFVPQWS